MSKKSGAMPLDCQTHANVWTVGNEPGSARVALQTHLISWRYASTACSVVGLEGGPSVGTPKAIIFVPVSHVCALAGLI